MKVGIIGGGAAGIMSALFACKGKNEVTVIEHNDKLLKKILSTGNGKCNFTNIKMDSSHFHNNDRVIKFIERFNQYDIIKFFNSIGVVEYIKDGYVYPNSEQAASIRNALLMELGRYDVKILLNTYVKDINKNSDVFQLNICNTENKNIKKLYFDKIIIATGLMAAPKLGSDGSFLPLLKRLNIKYNTCLPALCGISLDNKNFFKTASGVRAKGKISVIVDGKTEAGDFGELQFSDTGISGIPTFQISRYVSLYLNKNKLQSGNYASFTSDLLSLANELKDKILFGDQDLLNFYFKDNWVSLSQEYNFQLANMKLYNKEQKVNPAIIHFTGAAKPLGPVYIDYECVKKVVPLFRIYDSASWDDIVNLPIGTITLKISD